MCARVTLLGRQPSRRWVRSRLPHRPVEWTLLRIQHRRSGISTVRPYTRSHVFRLCGANVVDPQVLRQLVPGPGVQASAGARCTGRRRKCLSTHPPPRQAVIIPRGWSLPPQAWRLMHLQGSLLEPGAPCDCKVCPLLRRDGHALPDRFLTTQMRLPPQRLASYMAWMMWRVRP